MNRERPAADDFTSLLLALVRRQGPPLSPAGPVTADEDLSSAAREAAWRQREAASAAPARPADGGRSDSHVPCQVVAVLGAKGGAGATFLAVNLAAAVSGRGRSRVLLVDLDAPSGDVCAYLDLPDEPDPGDWSCSLAGGSLAGWDDSVRCHTPSRLDCLPAPAGPAGGSSAAAVEALMTWGRERYDAIVIDAGSRLEGVWFRAIVAAASRVLLVTTPDAGGLRGARLALQCFREGIHNGDGLGLVVNRFDRRASVNVGEMRRLLGIPVVAIIPEDRRRVEASLFTGRCLVLAHPDAPAAEAVRQAAKALVPGGSVGTLEMPAPRGFRGWFRCLVRRGCVGGEDGAPGGAGCKGGY